ncbi:MAG: DMT family transporter [Woeseia sp.]
MGYIYLSIAIIAEVIATAALKATDEFTRFGPSVIVIAGYGTAFYFLSLVLRTVPLGVAYAIWSGVGIALISIVGVVLYKQLLDWPAVVGIALIVAGVATINLYSEVVA